ncbi:hypothetical protein [Kumtagia ephedrae]|uniref:Tetratrico peptide repeat group 5 domain-containing protein n=1 Tax=Kumtagia ephedrae TaxID=2116701 RepID=A0A2P7S2V6_9HYPH|nr:hypothetical protein [Mesorhizobium ephedrae]PSJ56810.1 hypothetical protein C7I84_20120 [Mesorhizobium ephedrae]
MEESGRLLREFAESAPDYPAPHFYLADIYFDQGRYRESLAESLEAARIVGEEGMAKIYRAAQQGYAADGREGLLEAMLAEQLGQHAQGKVSAYKVARTLAFLDRTEPALTHLALAVAEREPDSLGIKIDSAFRSLHGNARFRGILAQAGHAMSFSGEAVEMAVDAVRSGTEAPR